MVKKLYYDDKMDYVKALIVSILSFFVPIIPLLLLVGLFIFVDTTLGIWGAKKRGEKISSRKLGNIIPKILLYNGAILTGYVLDVLLLGEFISILFSIDMLFTKLIAMTLIFIEMVSIDENFTSITGKNLFRSFKIMISRASNLKDELKNLND